MLQNLTCYSGSDRLRLVRTWRREQQQRAQKSLSNVGTDDGVRGSQYFWSEKRAMLSQRVTQSLCATIPVWHCDCTVPVGLAMPASWKRLWVLFVLDLTSHGPPKPHWIDSDTRGPVATSILLQVPITSHVDHLQGRDHFVNALICSNDALIHSNFSHVSSWTIGVNKNCNNTLQ